MAEWGAIVLAAGQGKRMHSPVAKQFLLLDGRPVLYYSLKAFEESGAKRIILVTGEMRSNTAAGRLWKSTASGKFRILLPEARNGIIPCGMACAYFHGTFRRRIWF